MSDTIANDKPCPHCGRYDNRGVSVDALIIKDDKILLIRRGAEPDKGKWATPGGYIGWDESAHDAVMREVKEETGLSATKATFLAESSSPNRHPRQVITLAFLVSVDDAEPQKGDDADEVQWFSLDKLPTPLAFDHEKTISLAVSRRQT